MSPCPLSPSQTARASGKSAWYAAKFSDFFAAMLAFVMDVRMVPQRMARGAALPPSMSDAELSVELLSMAGRAEMKTSPDMLATRSRSSRWVTKVLAS